MPKTEAGRRSFLKHAGSAAAVMTLAGRGSAGTKQIADDERDPNLNEQTDEEVRITYGAAVEDLDPHTAGGQQKGNTTRHMYEGILFREKDGTISPALATEWERMEAGRIRLQIREGVTFHNGDELVPEDIVYTVRRILDDDVGLVANDAFVQGVTGAEVVEGERAVDLISFNGERFNYLGLDSAADGIIVMQKEWSESTPNDEIAQSAMGTGPYQLENFESGVTTEVSRFEDYWGDLPEFGRVTFTNAAEDSTRVSQLITGETDLIENVPTQSVSRVQNTEGVSMQGAKSQRIIFATMRTDIEPFSSVKFRKALNLAIDQESIIENVLDGFGELVNQPTIPGFVGHNEDIPPIPYDPERAAELVEESGHAGAEITFTTPNGRYLKDVTMSQAATEFIDELPNVSATTNPVDWGSIAGNFFDGDISTNPDLSLIGMGVTIPDAIASFNVSIDEGAAIWVGEGQEKAQELIDEVRTIESTEDRIPLYKEINKVAHDYWPFIWMTTMFRLFGVSDDVQWEPRIDGRFVFAFEMSPA